MAWNELNCNLVLSGVDETLQSPENTTDVVLQTCRDVLNIEIAENEIVEAVRLGPLRNHKGADSRQPSKWPRSILEKTNDM